MGQLFHITTRLAWNHAQAAREYRPASLASEGFIHLSTEQQWRHTLHRFYRGEPDLVVLCIDPARVRGEVRYVEADGDTFPHLHGPLDTHAVTSVRDAPRLLEVDAAALAHARAADAAVASAVVCEVLDRGRLSSWCVFEPRPGHEGKISLVDAQRALGWSGDVAGSIQLTSFPRTERGALDEVALLALIEALVAGD